MKKTIIVCLILLMSIVVGCKEYPVEKELIIYGYDDVGTIRECIGVSMSFEVNSSIVDINNMTDREIKYYMLGMYDTDWYPLNISFSNECNPNGTIPYKIYENFVNIPMENDCYDESHCYLKWDIQR